MKVLLIDDEIATLEMFALRLERSGFEVLRAQDGPSGLELAVKTIPDLIFLDLRMPVMDGFEVYERLKREPITANIPVIILTCQDDLASKIRGLESGIDDYLIKDEVDLRELSARAKSVISRAQQRLSANPLTHLPGNLAIEQEISKRLASTDPFAVGYIDIDNFKPFNDHFGFATGDRLIAGLGRLLKRIFSRYHGFVGHIGGDDFIYITDNSHEARAVAREVISNMPALRKLCGTDSRFTGKDRKGNPSSFPPVSLSVAILWINDPANCSLSRISREAADIKQALKSRGGNSFAVVTI